MITGGLGNGDKVLVAVVVLTLLNHLVTGFKLLAHRRKTEPMNQQIQIQQIPHPNHENDQEANNLGAMPPSSSLMDHKTTCRTVTLTCLLGPFIMLPIYAWDGLFGILRVSLICVPQVFLPISMYMGKKHLRDTLWREVRGFFQ